MRLFLFFIFSIQVLTSCQVYRNNGRNLFESAAPGQIVNPNLTTSSTECWTQPQNEALWFAQPNKQYNLHLIGNSELEVCSEAANQAD